MNERAEFAEESSSGETNSFIPVISIRPHHLFDTDIQESIARRDFPSDIARNFTDRIAVSKNEYGTSPYYEQLLGSTKSHRRFQNTVEIYLTRLQDLPDNSSIQLDLEPDGICNSCFMKTHCLATNYLTLPEEDTIHTLENELVYLQDIRAALENRGYILGKDFIEQSTTHILHDFGGRDIGDIQPAIAHIVVFPSLIVRTKALRSIIDDLLDEESH